jgi:thiosulfate reductase cytochrome b subunit
MADSGGQAVGETRVRRHALPVRLWHWLNALTVLILLMSGLMIFNAHPRLYWGDYGANPDAPWLVIGSGGALAFPGWITIPSTYSLADARIWHLAFAWVLALGLLAFLLWALVRGHIRRDLHLARAEWHPAAMAGSLQAHDPLRYNPLQKLLYGAVLFGLLPLAVLTGLTMSPAMDAAWPWLLDLFGGRQSARSLHFIAAMGLCGFFLVHMAALLRAGPVRHVGAMVTGWMRVGEAP